MSHFDLSRSWDAIVVGSGLGGGVVGRALVERGLSVLFLEKGAKGWRTDESGLSDDVDDPVARAARGAWPDPIEVLQDGVARRFFAPLGCGVGGSSVYYAATLERPEPHELDGHWPVSYDAMSVFYAAAETIFQVHGDPSPYSQVDDRVLPSPPLLGPADAAIMTRLRSNGMHPYRLHTALRYLPGCTECMGRKCPRDCRMDGRSAGIEPALNSGRAALLHNCDVVRLLGTADRVTGIEARWEGRTITLSAPRVVLAAGAFSTPRLLMASASEAWPQGCGNGADLVGRNLMLHMNEIFAIWPRIISSEPAMTYSKSLGLRDLMHLEGQRFGMVQSLGVVANERLILHAMRESLAQSSIGRTRLAREVARIPAKLAAVTLGSARLFVGLLEDRPDPSNRVVFDPASPDTIRAEYHVTEELRVRRADFRRAIRRTFRGLRPLFLNYKTEPNWGHGCGTTRMGETASSSVVDSSCRVHGVRNLWITDAGVFPTSMGVNPSLTIAANALRVGQIIARTSFP